jgi:hypothetical protein
VTQASPGQKQPPADPSGGPVPPADPPPGGGAPAQAYRSAVSEIIDARRPTSPYPASAPTLAIGAHHRPLSVVDLAPAEQVQLRAVWAGEGGVDLAEVLADEENHVEAAEVVDESGAVRYRLYGWNFGVGYLFPPEGLDVIAFGSQHDIEHWSPAQRDLFAAMDRALRAGGH